MQPVNLAMLTDDIRIMVACVSQNSRWLDHISRRRNQQSQKYGHLIAEFEAHKGMWSVLAGRKESKQEQNGGELGKLTLSSLEG